MGALYAAEQRKSGSRMARDRSTEGDFEGFCLPVKQCGILNKLFILCALSRTYALKLVHDFGKIEEFLSEGERLAKKPGFGPIPEGRF